MTIELLINYFNKENWQIEIITSKVVNDKRRSRYDISIYARWVFNKSLTGGLPKAKNACLD